MKCSKHIRLGTATVPTQSTHTGLTAAVCYLHLFNNLQPKLTLLLQLCEEKDMLPHAFLPKTTADHDLWQWFNINTIVMCTKD